MSLKLRADSDRRKLIEPLAAKYDLPPGVVKDVLDDALAAIMRMASETGRLQLRGFGVFRRKDTPELQRRNPRTGAQVVVPARSRVVFIEEGTHRRPAPRAQSEAAGLQSQVPAPEFGATALHEAST